ncbi:MAG: hypothetical protein Q9M33_07965 [Robiginitomaculum sp.]|nr:hypothetical protein [Robiginitomaculum sp.]MDQ7078084.1 hypothetical protein [Robiginitomaculum sp.]
MRLQAMIIALSAALLVTGCTTFSLSREDTIVQQNGTSKSAVFRRGAMAFQDQFSKAGWLREEESKSRTKAFMAILSKGWAGVTDDKKKHNAKPRDAVSLYLARLKDKADDRPAAVAEQLQLDLGDAYAAMARLNELAMPLITPTANRSPEIMRADVMVLERALLSARKAQSLFESAGKRLYPTLELIVRADIASQIERNAKEITRMKALADTLNDLRLQGHPIG